MTIGGNHRKWALVTLILAPALLLSADILWRWSARPLFASLFSASETELLPTWHYVPCEDGEGTRILLDKSANQVLVICAAKGLSLSPITGSRSAVSMRTSNGYQITVERRPGTLTIVAPDLSVHAMVLGPGQGLRIYGAEDRAVKTGGNVNIAAMTALLQQPPGECVPGHVRVVFIGVPK